MNTTIRNIIDIIKAVPVSLDNSNLIDETEHSQFIAKAASNGYIFDPKAMTCEAFDWISRLANTNATFYKNWNDIVSKNRIELFLDQVRHYASTYGTDFQGEAWVPNDGMAPFIPFEKFTYMKAVTLTEAADMCMNILSSGIALNDDTMKCIVSYLIMVQQVDLDRITNKEAQILICDCLHITPTEKFSLLRYIVYKTIGSTSIIQNDATYQNIASTNQNDSFDFTTLSDTQLHNLAQIFYRYKKIFMAFRHTGVKNASVINKIRRYAVKDHQPMIPNIMQTILSWKNDAEVPVEILKLKSNYELIRLIQAIRERYNIKDGDYKQYTIRNGKIYNAPAKASDNVDFLTRLEMVCIAIISSRLKGDKHRIFILPDNIHIAAPTSEKNFVGAFPAGSYVQMGRNNYVGVYWRGADGASDFDLHYEDIFGSYYGWDAPYNNGSSLIFSGDMTSADPEATEVYYCKAGIPNGIFTLNRYMGTRGSKYKLFFAQNDEFHTNLEKGYMVDPNDIIAEIPMVSEDSQTRLGFVFDNRFYFSDNKSGNSIIPKYHKTMSVENSIEILSRKVNSYVDIEELFKMTGSNVFTASVWEDVKKDFEEMENVEIVDLSNPSKEQIINLFNNNIKPLQQ